MRLTLPIVLGMLVASLCLGCATPTGKPATDATAADSGKDRVTASDESDASKRARVRLELASLYFTDGQMNTALDQVKLAITADPSSSAAYNLRGLIYANLGDERLAEDSFRRALQLNPKDGDAMQNFGYYLCQKTRYAEADALFDQAMAIPRYASAPRTWFTKGVCQAQAGQLPQSEASLQRSYELDPTNPATSITLAEVLYRRGEYERARFYVRRVNALPGAANAQTYWLAARIENRLGNQTGVQEFGGQLRRRFPEAPETRAFNEGRFDG